jgi:hypothetical protein
VAPKFWPPVCRDWHWIGYQVNLMFFILPDAKPSPYITVGGGYYIWDKGKGYGKTGKGGINTGIGMEYFLRNHLALDAGLRFHCIAFEGGPDRPSADSVLPKGWDFRAATYVQIYAGLTYYFGI